jgi:hypothetical protein
VVSVPLSLLGLPKDALDALPASLNSVFGSVSDLGLVLVLVLVLELGLVWAVFVSLDLSISVLCLWGFESCSLL